MGTICTYAVPATNLLLIRRVRESSSLSMLKYDIVVDEYHVRSVLIRCSSDETL